MSGRVLIVDDHTAHRKPTRLVLPATAGISIVARTAHAMKGGGEKDRAAGGDGCPTNPMDVQRLPGQVGAAG